MRTGGNMPGAACLGQKAGYRGCCAGGRIAGRGMSEAHAGGGVPGATMAGAGGSDILILERFFYWSAGVVRAVCKQSGQARGTREIADEHIHLYPIMSRG